MAPSSEYSTASGGGGRLKLKGSKVQDGRVEKKRKKKKVRKDDDNDENKDTELDVAQKEREGSNDRERGSRGGSESAPVIIGKTEAERRYEEARRKRLSERLKREGVKSHKERVEELNQYLSNLSEHHDMPKIGPG